ncbi:MAG TPA: hypothetical protein VNP96_07615 [Solirubrobacterales bacterium]|nr:hypothetical protein [Solirubrobacterales bacterium]
MLMLKQEEPMPVQRSDWDRIRKNVARLGEPLSDHATTWAATAVGAAIGLVTTIVVITKTETTVQAGVVPSLWVGFGACVLFAICFAAIGRNTRSRHHVNVVAVCEDMDDVAVDAGHQAGVLPSKEMKNR